MTPARDLSIAECTAAGILLALVILLAALLRLGVSTRLTIAGVRMALQLTLVGMILGWVFRLQHLAAIVAIMSVMLLAAGREVVARSEYRLAGVRSWLVGTGAMGLSTILVALFLLAVVIRPEPMWQPQYSIPILGMLLGNTMNGIAIACERLTSSVVRDRTQIEARLALGHTAHDAVSGHRREAMRAGLIPVINGMSIAGIVSLPGMMTGQILAGQDPEQAVRYQILIWLGIAAGTGFGTLAAVSWTMRSLIDDRQRLRVDRLKRRNA